MKVTLPVPPSSNRYWRKWRNRMVRNPEADTYRQIVKVKLFNAGYRKPIEGRIVWSFVWYRAERRGDLTNRIKILEDALNGLAFNDDKEVVEFWCRREDDKLNPRVVVTVEAAP